MQRTMAFHSHRHRVVDGIGAGDVALDPTSPCAKRVAGEFQEIGSSTGDGDHPTASHDFLSAGEADASAATGHKRRSPLEHETLRRRPNRYDQSSSPDFGSAKRRRSFRPSASDKTGQPGASEDVPFCAPA